MNFLLLLVCCWRRLRHLCSDAGHVNPRVWYERSPEILGGTLCVQGVAETPVYWVIPGGDSDPTKRSPHHHLCRSGAEHNRNCGTDFLPEADTPASQGGVSGSPQCTMCQPAPDKGRNLPGSFGAELLFQVLRAETPVWPDGDSGPTGNSGGLKAEFPVQRRLQRSEIQLHYICRPFLLQGVETRRLFILVLTILSPPLL